jgi:hypothetical protein
LARPRNQSCTSCPPYETVVGVALLPAYEPPSQYETRTLFQSWLSGFTRASELSSPPHQREPRQLGIVAKSMTSEKLTPGMPSPGACRARHSGRLEPMKHV